MFNLLKLILYWTPSNVNVVTLFSTDTRLISYQSVLDEEDAILNVLITYDTYHFISEVKIYLLHSDNFLIAFVLI